MTRLLPVLITLALLAGCGGPAASSPTHAALPTEVADFSGDPPESPASPSPSLATAARSESPTATAASHPTPATTALPGGPSAAAPTAPAPSAAPTTASTSAPTLLTVPLTRTAHLDIYRVEGGLAITTLLELAPQFEEAMTRVGARLGARLSGRVAISFEPRQSGPCALRGITLSHDRRIKLYYAPDMPGRRVLAIVAHELAHELQHDYYGWDAHQRSDTILLEGQATWASGDYAPGNDGRPAWASAAERALAEGQLLPLATDLERDCRTTTRTVAYTGWASFVDFLISIYGRERFDALYRSGRGRAPGSADYTGVYGKPLDTLDQEWREWLAKPQTTM